MLPFVYIHHRGKNHVHVITTDKIADGFGQSNKRLRKAIKLLEVGVFVL